MQCKGSDFYNLAFKDWNSRVKHSVVTPFIDSIIYQTVKLPGCAILNYSFHVNTDSKQAFGILTIIARCLSDNRLFEQFHVMSSILQLN